MPGFGQNGSVEWIVRGRKGNQHVHTSHQDGWRGSIKDPPIEYFKVRLRYKDQASADAAWAAREHGNLFGEYVVTLHVPAQPPNAARTHLDLLGNDEPRVNPPWEIDIDW